MGDLLIHYEVFLRALTKPVQFARAYLHTIGGSHSTHNHLGCTMHPKVTSFSNFSPTYHRGEHKPMHQMQWQEHSKWSSPSLPNPTKATNAREGFERKNKGETLRNSKYQDPKGSPHLEEKPIGGNADVDLLCLFPQKLARTIGGIER